MGILVNQNQIGGGSSNSSHNIGDIFYTTRTDNSLNGAVECNGSQYNFSDFDSNLQSLFDDGSIPSVTINKFDSMVTNQGGCDSFGYKTDTEWGQWDTMTVSGYVYTKPGHDAVGDPVYDAPGGNIIAHITRVDNENRTLIYYEDTDGTTSDSAYWNASVNGPVESTPYFKVPKKLSRVLVRTQKPTSSNNYTYFNLYADGWVEQGGKKYMVVPGNSQTVRTAISLPIEMNNVNYNTQLTQEQTTGAVTLAVAKRYEGATQDPSTQTTLSIIAINNKDGNYTTPVNYMWQVSGYAASSEYAKDKWNYQNVQVERPMIQLFNSTTDVAVATCNQVLADVSALNQGDYVIETQLPTEENNYSWYRLYKSGWIEQGKTTSIGNLSDGESSSVEDTFIITMANTNYQVITTPTAPNYSNRLFANFGEKTTTGLLVGVRNIGGNTNSITVNWQVSGMSAQK